MLEKSKRWSGLCQTANRMMLPYEHYHMFLEDRVSVSDTVHYHMDGCVCQDNNTDPIATRTRLATTTLIRVGFTLRFLPREKHA